jgi:hypothetical protein
MSLSHKAYVLDYVAFERDLAPTLLEALATGRLEALDTFVRRHEASLSFPWGGALPEDWRKVVERVDVQMLGDVAFTRFYDPDADRGLAEKWMEISARLDEDAKRALLGAAFGPPDRLFDPGAQGSYFQNRFVVERSCDVLGTLRDPALDVFLRLLREARESQHGLYVTF